MPELSDGLRNRIETWRDRLKTDTTLSDREAEVIAWKSHGFTAGDIADELEISENTVREYIKRGRAKAKRGKTTYDVLRHLDAVDEHKASWEYPPDE